MPLIGLPSGGSVSNATAAVAGILMLTGDLGGTGSVYNDPRVGKLTGVAGVVSVRDGAALAVGETNIANAGDVRVKNATTIVSSRNAANTGNLDVLGTNGSDMVLVGGGNVAATLLLASGATRFSVTSTLAALYTPLLLTGSNGAQSGDIRASNNTTIVAARNAANSADIAVLATDASNNTIIDTLGTGILRRGGSARLAWDASTVTSYVPLLLGSGTVSTTGDIRASNNTTIISARNAANTANIAVLATDASDNVLIKGGVVVPATYASMYINSGTFATGSVLTAYAGTQVTGSGITTSTTNGTITIVTVGVYRVVWSGSLVFNASSGTAGNGTVVLRKGGAAVNGGTRRQFYPSTGTTTAINIDCILSLAASDVLDVTVSMSTGGDIQLNAASEGVFSAHRVG